MTSTTTETIIKDLGNGWIRQGPNVIWAGTPRTLYGRPSRELLRLSCWRKKDDKDSAVLRIEAGDLEDGDLASLEDVDDGLCGGGSVNLPTAALPQLADMLVRVLGSAPVIDVITRINDERGEYIERLFNAVGGDMDATLGEAEAALKAQKS